MLGAFDDGVAVGEVLGDVLGVVDGVVDVFNDILHVATANMYAQLVPLLARKGMEVNDLVLVAYGGAGPTHACLLAEDTGIRRVLVPPSPGTLCARGALTMDVKSTKVKLSYKTTTGTGTKTVPALSQGGQLLIHLRLLNA